MSLSLGPRDSCETDMNPCSVKAETRALKSYETPGHSLTSNQMSWLQRLVGSLQYIWLPLGPDIVCLQARIREGFLEEVAGWGADLRSGARTFRAVSRKKN